MFVYVTPLNDYLVLLYLCNAFYLYYILQTWFLRIKWGIRIKSLGFFYSTDYVLWLVSVNTFNTIKMALQDKVHNIVDAFICSFVRFQYYPAKIAEYVDTHVYYVFLKTRAANGKKYSPSNEIFSKRRYFSLNSKIHIYSFR